MDGHGLAGQPVLVDGDDTVALDNRPAVDQQQLGVGREPSTRAATGSAMSAWAKVSSRQSARSASLPSSTEPRSALRPSTAAPPSVAISSASRTRAPADRRGAGEQQRAPDLLALLADSLLAAPSTPSPTRAPASRRSRARAMPDPRRPLDEGQCATPVPVAPIFVTASSSRCTAWATRNVGAQPAEALHVVHR